MPPRPDNAARTHRPRGPSGVARGCEALLYPEKHRVFRMILAHYLLRVDGKRDSRYSRFSGFNSRLGARKFPIRRLREFTDNRLIWLTIFGTKRVLTAVKSKKSRFNGNNRETFTPERRRLPGKRWSGLRGGGKRHCGRGEPRGFPAPPWSSARRRRGSGYGNGSPRAG